LFSKIMREAIINLSDHPDVTAVSNAAVNAFMSAAIQPGLDVTGINPYPLAQDLCATIRTVLEYINRQPLLRLHKIDDGMVGDTPWSFISPMDDTGAFHRWVFVDYISTDTIYHHSRSWETWADMCVAPAMCWLHIVAIGVTRDGRRQSPWSKCYAHPTVARLYKFKRRNGDLQGDWKPVFYAESSTHNPVKWVDLMLSEDVITPLVYNVGMPEPTEQQRKEFVSRDFSYLSTKIKSVEGADPFTLPMCRTSCDTPYQCPHEFACYSPNPSLSILEQSGLYAKLSARKLTGLTAVKAGGGPGGS
jgi:hypothetical protein